MLDLRGVSKYYSTRSGRRAVLDNVNLHIEKSERVGILGRNGSGKSTLIRLIGGSEFPTHGEIHRGMSVSWPLAFSGGFQGSLTGLDNLRFVCRIYGATYENALPFVEEFTELGKYLREPVKKYSNGMRARLAFAISMAIEFDCFLIDEVLAVGDANFQEKCRRELFIKRHDRAMLMVSHDPHMIRDHCSRACVLEKGILREFADVDAAFDFYDEQTGGSGHARIVVPDIAAQSASVENKHPPTTVAVATSGTDPNWLGPNMTIDNQNERIVAAFYRHLLGREAELSGLKNHTQWMAQRNRETAVEDMLTTFLENDESRRYFERRSFMYSGAAPKHGAQSIDSIVSLGTHCYTSAFLKRFQHKPFSSVFDWIFSSPSMIAHALDDDFATFLDSSHYLPVPVEKREDGAEYNRVQHLFYQKHHNVNSMFNHHDVHEPADYAYFGRCVERFRAALSDGSKTLFLLIREEQANSVQEFEQVRDALRRRSPDSSFMFVAIAKEPARAGLPTIDLVSRDGNAVLNRFAASSPWHPMNFVDSFDEVCLYRAIFKDFQPPTQ